MAVSARSSASDSGGLRRIMSHQRTMPDRGVSMAWRRIDANSTLAVAELPGAPGDVIVALPRDYAVATGASPLMVSINREVFTGLKKVCLGSTPVAAAARSPLAVITTT